MKTLITLTGPTCSGKTTLEKRLVKDENFVSLVSTTTRPKRDGEIEGYNYHYVSIAEFNELATARKLAEQVYFNGHYYGITIEEIEKAFDSGKPVVVVVEPTGLHQLMHCAAVNRWNIIPIFIDIEPATQLQRFVERTRRDYESEGGFFSATEMKSLFNRLHLMSKEEQRWRYEAEKGEFPYSRIFNGFTSRNTDEVVNAVVYMANHR